MNDCVVGNGFATVGVGPGSELGSISAGINSRRGRRWGWERVDARKVKVNINFGKWEEGRDGRLSSIGYISDSDCAIWCVSEDIDTT